MTDDRRCADHRRRPRGPDRRRRTGTSASTDGCSCSNAKRPAGGIPRHSDHPGYGIRDLHRFISGPAYARRLVATAKRAGAESADRDDGHRLGRRARRRDHQPDRPPDRSTPAAIILATGARERPRPARLIAGDRAAGIYTTGQLQNLVHLHHQTPGTRAVIVGAELVSWSAAMTLREGRLQTRADDQHPSKARVLRRVLDPRTVRARYRGRHPHARRAHHRPRPRRSRRDRTPRHPRPAHDRLRHDRLHRRLDPRQRTRPRRGPRHRPQHARTGSRHPPGDLSPGIFAIGNLNHPVDTADVAALDGRAVANQVLAYLRNSSAHPGNAGPRILPGRRLKWITPGILWPDVNAPRNRLLAWPTTQTSLPTVAITQDSHRIARRRLPWPASPGRVFRIPTSLLKTIDPAGGPITIDLQ